MSEFFDPYEKISKTKHNLGHWHQDDTWIFITWRLADSIPASVLKRWQDEKNGFLSTHPEPWDDETKSEYHRRFTMTLEKHLDDAHGSCCLAQHHSIVSNAIHHFDGMKYDTDCFVIMPNHIHLLFKPSEGHTLPDIIHSLKSFTAKEIQKARNQKGPLWQADYWDRLIRTQQHFDWTQKYIQENPTKLKPGTYALWKKY